MIFEKASNLRVLMTVLHIGPNSRMVLPSPWISLKNITLSCLRFGHIFQGMKLEEILPHIVRFIIQERDARKDREPSLFPDLSGCQHLIIAVFFNGVFRFQTMINSGEKLPLPFCLENLNLHGCRFHEEFMNHIKLDDMKKIIPSLKFFRSCNN